MFSRHSTLVTSKIIGCFHGDIHVHLPCCFTKSCFASCMQWSPSIASMARGPRCDCMRLCCCFVVETVTHCSVLLILFSCRLICTGVRLPLHRRLCASCGACVLDCFHWNGLRERHGYAASLNSLHTISVCFLNVCGLTS